MKICTRGIKDVYSISVSTFISGSRLLGVEGVDVGVTPLELPDSGSTPFLSL
jgi:hypothetical protein